MARILLARPRRSLGARKRSLGGSLLASGAGQALLVISGVLVARALGPADRGYFALLVVVSSVCTLLGSGGLPTALTYFIARDKGSAKAVVGSLVAPVAVQVAATAVVQFGVMFAFTQGDPQRVKVAALVSLLLVPGILAQNYGLAILQGQERFLPFNVFRVLPSLVYTAAVLAVFILGVADIVILMAMWAAALLSAGILALAVSVRRLPGESQSVSSPSRSHLFKFGLKSLVGSVSPIDALRLDQAVVGLLLAPITLGYYVVAQAFTNLPRVVAQSVGMVAYPAVASQSSLADRRRAVWRYFLLGVALATFVIGALELVTGRLVEIFFGGEFDSATPIARVLLLATLFMSARRVLTDGVNGLGRPGLGTIAEISSWVLLVPTIAVLLPAYGAVGVALALAISWLVSLVLLIALVLGSGSALFARIDAWRFRHDPRTVGPPAFVSGFAVLIALLSGVAVVRLPLLGSLMILGLFAAVLFFAMARASFGSWKRGLFVRATQTYPNNAEPAALEPGSNGLGGGRFFFYAGVLLVAILTLRAGGQVTFSDILFLFSFCFVGAEIMITRRPVPLGIPPLLIVGMGLFSLGGLFSTFGAVEPVKSAAVVARLLFLTIFWFWLTSAVLNRQDRVQRAVTFWIVSAALAGAAGILQVVAGDVIPNTDPAYGRSTGFTNQPNDLGGICAVAFVPAVMLATRPSLSARHRVTLVGLVFLTGGGLISSGSVGALLAASAAIFVWVAIQRMSLHSWFVFGGIIAIAVVVVTVQGLRGAPTPLERITSVTTPSTAATATSGSGSFDSRVAVYKVALSRIEADPFIGVGLDLVSITKPYGVVSYEYDVHNLVIGTWYKAGLFGVIGILVAIVALLRAGTAALGASLSEDERRTAAGLISAVVAFTVFAMSEPVLFSRYGWIPAALLVALRTVQEGRRAAEPYRAPMLLLPSESRALASVPS